LPLFLCSCFPLQCSFRFCLIFLLPFYHHRAASFPDVTNQRHPV
jgi:hypothetical protein